eukprot:5558317-Alexandrium_andersonii.AAC.1
MHTTARDGALARRGGPVVAPALRRMVQTSRDGSLARRTDPVAAPALRRMAQTRASPPPNLVMAGGRATGPAGPAPKGLGQQVRPRAGRPPHRG